MIGKNCIERITAAKFKKLNEKKTQNRVKWKYVVDSVIHNNALISVCPRKCNGQEYCLLPWCALNSLVQNVAAIDENTRRILDENCKMIL